MGIPTMMDFMAFREVNPMEVNQPTFFFTAQKGVIRWYFSIEKNTWLLLSFLFFRHLRWKMCLFFLSSLFFF